MHEYDIALKSFLRNGRESLHAITSVTVDRWHNVELAEVRNLRVDLLGESTDGGLLHIELQSTHDANMALRMLEYCAAVSRQFGRFPEQIVLYVGEAALRMNGVLRGPGLTFEYRIVDIRELDGGLLLESRATIRRILARIAAGDPAERAKALAGFLILAGLRRRAAEVIEQEASQMPILDDIIDHPVLGREFKRGREQGLEEGRLDGELAVLRRQIEKRFGSVPPQLRDRLTKMSGPDVEAAALRLLDAQCVKDLLG